MTATATAYRLRSGEVHLMRSPYSIGTLCLSDAVVGAEATEDATGCARCAARLAELDAPAPAPEPEPALAGTVVVIGCGKAKRTEPAAAGDLYVGSYHRQARRAADAIAARTGARVMILSAKHGLIDPADVVAPYDVTFTHGPRPYRGGPVIGTVDSARIARQLAATGARTVVALAGREYASRLAAAARVTGAECVEPLAGTGGIGPQLRRLAELRDGGPLADALADALAGPVAESPAVPLADVVDLVDYAEDARGQLALFAA